MATITHLTTTTGAVSVTDPVITAAVGDYLVVIGTCPYPKSDGSDRFSSFTDSDGINTYTVRANIKNALGDGSAQSGTQLIIATCAVTDALTNATITGNKTEPAPTILITVYRVQSSGTITYVGADASGSVSNTTLHSAATVSVTLGNVIFGAAAVRTTDAISGDSDSTNGSWSTLQTASSTQASFPRAVASQYKVVSSTGNQSWACSTTSARLSARSYVVLHVESAAFSLATTQGAYHLNGTAATMRLSMAPLAAGAGAYALTGTIVAPSVGHAVAALAGSYTLTGSDAGGVHGYRAVADVGTYTLTGTDALLSKTTGTGKVISAISGSYALIGTAATLAHGIAIAAGAGSYAYTGTDASFPGGKRITAGDETSDPLLDESGNPILDESGNPILVEGILGGAYVMSGTAVTLTTGVATFVGYLLTGTDVTLTKTTVAGAKIIVADAGSYALTGTPATLISSAQPAVSPLHIGEWPVDKRKRRAREDAQAKEQKARKRFRDAIGRLLEGLPPEFDEPADLAEAEVQAVQALNLLRAMYAPQPELDAVSQLIDHVRQLRIAQPLAQLHLAQAYNQAHRHLRQKDQEDAAMAVLMTDA